jgi:drug/metabolite transporter (DMT)-like permease
MVPHGRGAAVRTAGAHPVRVDPPKPLPMNLILGIAFAAACALATNIGFLYKHRGACQAPAVDVRRPLWTARKLFSSKLFAIGFLVATGAWVFHVAAMAVAPLSVVQSVLAGGIVMLAVIAERSFGLRISRRQWGGIALTAVGLLLLGLSLPAVHGAHSRFSVPAMIAFEGVLLVAGTVLVMGPRIGMATRHHGFMLGAASGILFGVSDVAVKAISGEVGAHGPLGLATPWLLMAVVASVAAFYASAKGLQDGDAVPVIAITGTAANVAGIVGGIVVFGDPLSGHPVMLAVECAAFVLVLGAAWLTPAPVRAAAPVGVAAAAAA